MTYREVVYIINDILKLVVSDDSYYETDHILFLADKFRGFIVKKYYDSVKKNVPRSYYQEICVDLEDYGDGYCEPTGSFKRSRDCMPILMDLGISSVESVTRFRNEIVLVTPERFRYCEGGKYYSPIYATIDNDNRLYLRNSNGLYLNKVRVVGVFENSNEAEKFSCCENVDGDGCDYMDKKFPMEDNFVPELINMVVNELSIGSYKPADNTNNAKDDLSDIAGFIRNYMKDYYTRNNLNKNLDNQSIDTASV